MDKGNYDRRPPPAYEQIACLERMNEQLQAKVAELEKDAARYAYIRKHHEWRRSGELIADGHSFVGCRFPYLANFSCATMLDYNIDKMIKGEAQQG